MVYSNNIVAHNVQANGPNEPLHMAPLGEGNMRVSIDAMKVIKAFSCTYLGETTTVWEAAGCHEPWWPKNLSSTQLPLLRYLGHATWYPIAVVISLWIGTIRSTSITFTISITTNILASPNGALWNSYRTITLIHRGMSNNAINWPYALLIAYSTIKNRDIK